MFKAVPIEAVPSDAEDESDDNISLTSTVSGHDPEQEFGVENILAEDQFNGETYYLVEWTGFPLHESTWEPESNLGDELKAMWEEDKAKHATGELEPFNIQKLHDAREKAEKEKENRHRRRNSKRKKLGLPLTPPLLGGEESEDSTDEEAIEKDVDSVEDPAPTPKAQTQQRAPTVVPTSRPAVPPIITTSVASSARLQNEAERHGIGQEIQELPTEAPNKRKQTAPPQPTGYQGTARRPSNKASADALLRLKPRPLSTSTPSVPPTKPNPRARKALTAKKSTTQPSGNIFVSGTMRKQRASLKEAMSDSTKEPKLFGKHRQRRLAQLRSRDQEDNAPDLSKMQLFDLRSGQVFNKRNSEGSVLSPTQLSPQLEAPTASAPLQASALPLAPALVSPRTTTDTSEDSRPQKKRKSVRFNVYFPEDGLVHEPEPMDLDAPIHRRSSLKSPPPPSPLEGPNLDQTGGVPLFQGRQNFDKKLVLGQSSIGVTFTGLPREPSTRNGWLVDFLGKETLDFTHTCFAGTMANKRESLVRTLLASGTIVSQGDNAALGNVAQYLTGSLLALYHGQTEYNILVYPTKCEEWKSIPLHPDPTSPSEATLGYIIFVSDVNCMAMLPPLEPLFRSDQNVEDPKPEAKSKAERSAREQMAKRLFGFDYNRLLPVVSRSSAVHNFFLAIPPSRREVLLALYHWLRASNPTCQIFTSLHAGGWDAFRAQVAHMPGVVIIHETLAWSMRRFPDLSKYLITKYDEYWCFSEPVHGLPLYPSISAAELPPGEMRLTRLFPYRTAIFLSPSFLVSEPVRSLEFLKWFCNNWATKFPFRLVTAYNIHDYLSELAEERYEARKELWESPGDMLPEIEANLSGLSRSECSARYMAAELATHLHVSRTLQAGAFGEDEDNSSLVYADPSIDPNDEQSLVNWFGWWSTLRADQFRRFHVVGSSKAITMKGCKRGELRVRIPKYSDTTLNDPDAVLEVLQERNDQVEASEEEPNDENLNTPAGRANRANESSTNPGRWSFQSDLIRVEDANCFADYLDPVARLNGFRMQWMMYKYPVSWLDLQMAEHFGDFSANFSRFHDWFNFTFPFGACFKDEGHNGPKPFTGYNTYVGLFYTIDKEWDPDNPPPAKPLERHPWIAAYRPVNPHKKPYRRCELIIWDPAVRTRYPGKHTVAEKDLIYMQRQLIQYIRENGDAKNNGTFLDQVWLGGWDWPANCDARSPIDVTINFLYEMLSDIRNSLPAPERVMETKGVFRRIKLGSSSPSPTPAPAPAPTTRSPESTRSHAGSSPFINQERQPHHRRPDLMDTDTPDRTHPPRHRDNHHPNAEKEEAEEVIDENTRIIFHPPRGHTTTTPTHQGAPQPRSRCINRLYEDARLARAKGDAGRTHMRYRFVPTLEWYREQTAEGRGYAHVNVDSWEGVFNALKIGEGAAAGRERERGVSSGGKEEGRRGVSVGSVEG